MLFEYFGCLGTPPGGLGHHFEPKARIFVILVPFFRESLVPFGFLFWYFWDAFFTVFLSLCFLCFFVIRLGSCRGVGIGEFLTIC